MNRYDAGTPVVVEYILTPSTDATEVLVKYALQEDGGRQLGAAVSLTLSGGTVTRVGQGKYSATIDTTDLKSGMVVHQILASGTAKGAAKGAFRVDALPL